MSEVPLYLEDVDEEEGEGVSRHVLAHEKVIYRGTSLIRKSSTGVPRS